MHSTSKMLGLALSLLLLLATVAYGLRPHFSASRSLSRRSTTKLNTFSEHLLDCAANPQIAELLGSSNSMCLETSYNPLGGVGGLIEQAFTIGFLVMSYFFFKRTAGGVLDWERAADDDDEDDDVEEWANRNSEEEDDEASYCPQCNGAGRFASSACSLCMGSGRIEVISRSGDSSRSRNSLGSRGRRMLPPPSPPFEN